jgi:hypothetical protein
MEAAAMGGRGAVQAGDLGSRAPGGLPLLTSGVLGEYASEFGGIAVEARARGVAVLRLGTSGMRVAGVENVEETRLEGLFRNMEKHRSTPPKPGKRLSGLDPRRWGIVRQDLILTLALRHRIFQGAPCPKEALDRAENTLARGAEKKMELSQV